MSKREELIKELETVRLEIFRNAATLDVAIQDIINVIDDKNNDETYIRMSILQNATYREDMIKLYSWNKLLEKERAIWQELIDTTMEES